MPHVLLLCSPFIADQRFLLPLASAVDRQGFIGVVACGDGSNSELGEGWRIAVQRTAKDDLTVVVPYSGAGPLVPAAVARATDKPAAVVFMDASLAHPGRPRLDHLREALPQSAFAGFERALKAGASWPAWTDDELAPLIPSAAQRTEVLEMVTPHPLAFFEEVLPADDLPPGLPCGYLRLSPAYDAELATAQSLGWPTRSLHLTHFAPYTHPADVARELSLLVDALLPASQRYEQELRTQDYGLRTFGA